MSVELSNTRFETGISENNLRNWGVVEALKEFVQNAVYAKTILGNEVSIDHDGVYAYIQNTPSGFTKGKLLIGESEQSGVAGAPGEYGEGAKVAMAVATRCGRDVSIVTNGFTVKPALEASVLDNSVRSLVFYITDTSWDQGTRVVFQCSKEELDEATSYFAVLEGLDEDLTKTDTIIEDIPDTIYVNGVKITTVNSILSYNFTSPELMNRDRSSVDMAKVRQHVANTLSSVHDASLAAVVLQEIMRDNDLLEAQSGIRVYHPDFRRSPWCEASKSVLGDKVCMATGGASDTKARYHKFKVITNVPQAWRGFFAHVLDIPDSDELEEVRDRPKNVHRKPSADESLNLGWAKRLIKLYYADYGDVRVADVVYDQYGNSGWDGLYERATGITWIRRGILTDKERTFKVLLHETVHRVTGAGDNTEAFTRGWEHASWMILTRGKGE